MTRVLHVLYTFLPDVSGSSIRSAGILSGQLANGLSVAAISSPFQPGFTSAAVEEHAGVPVHRTYRAGNPLISERGSSIASRLRKLWAFPGFVASVRDAARDRGVDVIHAHSTFYCALAALIASRLLGVRVVYEFRSLWEERARSKGVIYRAQSALATLLETVCLRAVDRVVAINDALRDAVVARGVDASKVTVVPNAVEDSILELGRSVRAPTGFHRFGYVGNFSDIEGLDLLVAAFGRAFPAGSSASLAFWGTGPFEPRLRELAVASRDPRITVHGKFTRAQLQGVYDSLDCIVIARRRSLLTETVTPLKPLEAMAFGRLVIASDVNGLVEVCGGSANAIFFTADDVDALARTLVSAASDPDRHTTIASSGRRYVLAERGWMGVAKLYDAVYAPL